MKNEPVAHAALKYLRTRDSAVLATIDVDTATVVLSGSAGWGIDEGRDAHADWDIHVILRPSDYGAFLNASEGRTVFDDNEHSPAVFVQVRSREWLEERLEGRLPESWPLYLWIYSRCEFAIDNLNVCRYVQTRQAAFESELPDLVRSTYVRFAVRRLDTASAARRGLTTAARLSAADMVKCALQTYSLLRGAPYPYNKWLAKHVVMLDGGGEELSSLCDRCLAADSLEGLAGYASELRDRMQHEVALMYGESRWVSHWWEYNDN